MILIFLIMIASAILIYIACELFVNGIEWVGKTFNISQGVVGSVLAAFGTALPESVVTFIAVVFGVNSSQKDIGVGAALGGPLVLSTLGYAFIGVCIIIFSGRRKIGVCINANVKKLARDQVWFICIFICKVGLGLVAFAIKPWLGFLFLMVYAIYVYKEMSADTVEAVVNPYALKFSPKSVHPKKSMILFQTILALIFIFIGSQLFVHNLGALSISLGMSPHLVALLLSPVATELPEMLNVFIWVKQGKETLALANISGSMMIQATIPSALGIMFTPWMLDKTLIFAAIVTFLAILTIWSTLKTSCLSAKKLSLNALFHVIFIVGFMLINGSVL